MTECPKLNNFTANPTIIFVHNQDALRLSDYSRTIGTKVTVNCVADRNLVAESPIVTCLASGKWNFTTPPTCVDPKAPDTLTDGLTDEQTLIVAIVAGIGGLIFIVLTILVAAICRMQMKQQQKKKAEMSSQSRRDVASVRPVMDYDKYGLDRPYPYSPPPPPSYSSHDKTLARSQLQRGRGPIALPPAPSGHSVYQNPVYNASTMEREFAMSQRDDVLDVIARERMMQAADEREKYQTESRLQPDYSQFKEDRTRAADGRFPSRRFDNEGFSLDERGYSGQVNTYDVRRVADEPRYNEGNRVGGYQDDRARVGDHYGDRYEESRRQENRGRGNRHQTAKTRAARTDQYVEDHSDIASSSPPYERRTYDRAGNGRYENDDRVGYGRHENDDRAGYGRYENAAPVSRYEGQNYLTDPTMYSQGRSLGYDDTGPIDLNHWRPDTKPHFAGNRR